MEKVWKLTTIEDGEAGASYILSRTEALKAMDWLIHGGRIEEVLGTKPLVEIEASRVPMSSEGRLAA